jgi:hypothetical protein
MKERLWLWDSSPWWTRIGAILGSIAILWAVFMGYQLARHIGPSELPNNLKRPGLAMELVNNWDEAAQIVGRSEGIRCMQDAQDSWCVFPPEKTKIICTAKISALQRQQRLDYVFIVLYSFFFIYIGILNLRFPGIPFEPSDKRGRKWLGRISFWSGKLGGLGVLALTVLAAYWDWRENGRILEVLDSMNRHICSGEPFPLVRTAAYHKWLFIFAAIGCSSPLFLFWPGKTAAAKKMDTSVFVTGLAWLTALAALTTAFTGIAACHYGQDQRLESAAGTLTVTFLLAVLTLSAGQRWYGGLLSAVNDFASHRFVEPFARFLKDNEEQIEPPGEETPKHN